MSYKTIYNRNFKLVHFKKLLYINKLKLPEELIRIIKNLIFINYYDAAVIKFAESRKKRICTVFYNTVILRDKYTNLWGKVHKNYIDSFCLKAHNCFKCGDYLMISYNKNTQARCSIPLCNCDLDFSLINSYNDSIYEKNEDV